MIKEKEKTGKSVKAKKCIVEIKKILESLMEMNEIKKTNITDADDNMVVDEEDNEEDNVTINNHSKSKSIKKTTTCMQSGLVAMREACLKVELGCEEEEGGRFEWVDSLLVKCLRLGHWILLDNINLCRCAIFISLFYSLSTLIL